MSAEPVGVSFVVPVHNGAPLLGRVLDAIIAQRDGRPMEILVVDDGSTDDSAEILARYATEGAVTVLAGEGRGAAAAINLAARDVRHPIMCQVDQDVVIQPGWTAGLVAALSSPDVGAAQGCYVTPREATIWARVMGLDLQERYRRIRRADVDHVCTGNSAYRVEALRRVDLFDETLGYGYDNDMSYRLSEAGYRLVFCRDAVSLHHWREGVRTYLLQQYGVGYGRLDVIAKHPRRVIGDDVSGPGMILHAAGMLVVPAGLAIAGVVGLAGGPAKPVALPFLLLLLALVAERLIVGLRAAIHFRDPAGLLFAPIHLLRDCTWAAAPVVWALRRLGGCLCGPEHSMFPKTAWERPRPAANTVRFLALVPAHNEAASVPGVVADVRRRCPGCDVLVVDDASSDGTDEVVARLGVRWLRLPLYVGVGAAVRAGLRYAALSGYDTVVRIDGDGQHPADQVERVLKPIRDGHADAVLGSRYHSPPAIEPRCGAGSRSACWPGCCPTSRDRR